MGKLRGKVAIITGASMGMGRSEAHLFAQEGATVIITDINVSEGEKTTQEINAFGGKALFLKHDVASEEDWKRVIEETLKLYGKIDILVNNAGVLLQKAVEQTTSEEWDKIFNVNAKSVFYGCKYVAPAMRKAGGGSIVNISSIYGLIGAPSAAAYQAAKGAVRLLTKAVSVDYAKDKIRVNSVHPGLIETPMTEGILHDPREKEWFLSKTLLGRPGQAIEVAKAVLFLASEDSSYMTGSELVVDGGFTAQ
ncbi:MAG: glucose 1-dehydrogenase [Alphaproteobacteria bacterium]|nr:glucose 1-dehydrogenase [Alphaproteobacteria bacterium]